MRRARRPRGASRGSGRRRDERNANNENLTPPPRHFAGRRRRDDDPFLPPSALDHLPPRTRRARRVGVGMRRASAALMRPPPGSPPHRLAVSLAALAPSPGPCASFAAGSSGPSPRGGPSSSGSPGADRRPCYGGDADARLGLDFALTAEDAHAALRRWSTLRPLRPRVLRDGDRPRPTLYAAFLPHWIFDAEVSVRYRGKIGFDGGGDGKMDWTQIETWRDLGTTRYPASDPAVQVCASFRHRRDLVAAVQGPHVGRLPTGSTTRAESDAETQSSETSSDAAALRAVRLGASAVAPPLERFGMKRSLAWELASRRVRVAERRKAASALRAAHGCDATKDVVLEVELTPGSRRVRAAYLPVFVAQFTHGEAQAADGKIVPRRRTAYVCGATGAVVAGDEDLIDETKTRLLGVFAVGAVACPAALFFGPEAYAAIAAQAFLGSAVAATLAGVIARRIPEVAKARAEAARVAEEASAFAAATRSGHPNAHSRDAAGTMDASRAAWMDEATQQMRDDVEWGRWKATDVDHWDEAKREEWAANIWQWQRIRRRERGEQRARLALDRARVEEAERRDEEKARRWGPGWRKEARSGGPGGGLFGGFAGARDASGYYALLGLAEKRGAATAEEIKAAYRREAMAWHPDKHQGERAKARAARTFRKLQRAYQVLGNKSEREVYDGRA